MDLIDIMPLHIEMASSNPDAGLLNRIAVGDARDLDYPSITFEAVLLMGPMYHLVDLEDRAQALSEVRRVLKSGGLVIAATISKYASLLDGFAYGLIDDPGFREIVLQYLKDGQHRNPTHHPSYFTSAKFHTAGELQSELELANFTNVRTIAVEGFAGYLHTVNELDQPTEELLLKFLELTEDEPELKGVSAPLLGIGSK